jgi:hypothetical protein
MARLVYAAIIVTSVSLVSIFHGRPRVWAVNEVPVAFWAWRTQSPSESDIRAAVEKTHAQVVFLRAGQIDFQDGKLRHIRPLAGSFPRGIKLHLVYNATRTTLEQLESIDPQTLATEFARVYREDSERARRDGADVRGLQLDMDFPTRLLSRYERALNILHKDLQPVGELSITGLPTWMESQTLIDVLKNVDFWVPQFYGAEIPTHSSQLIPISSPQRISYFVNKARQIDKPFYAGLSAYSVVLLYSPSGSLITLRGDMNPSLVASDPNLELIDQHLFESAERRYTFRVKADGVIDGLNMRVGDVLVIDLPSTESLRIAAQISRKLAGKKLLGICVFRLPSHDDPATQNIEQVTAALTDRDSHTAVDVRLKSKPQINNAHTVVFEVKNSGTTTPSVGSLKVDVIVPAGSFARSMLQPGVSIQSMCLSESLPQPCSERRANLLRLTTEFLAPGQTLTTTLMLNRELPETTWVSVVMQTDNDQPYSKQNEIRIEREFTR